MQLIRPGRLRTVIIFAKSFRRPCMMLCGLHFGIISREGRGNTNYEQEYLKKMDARRLVLGIQYATS
jgi:hypothetical protein